MLSKSKVDGYNIQKVIGKGAFAVVYQGQNIKTKEIVAIKQISTDMEEGPHKKKMMELFQQEIKIMQGIKHKNIVELKDVQFGKDCINMIMEFCSLGDLEKYIKKNSIKNRLVEAEAKPIILQLIDAMKMLRLKNVVHRDLKLANILINEQMQIKLGDFGFAKPLVNSELLESYCGTPITMAPEILKRCENYDHKCDVWSIGVMIYQILYAQPPFVPQKGTVNDLIIAIQTQKLQFPQHVAVSAECKDLLRKMLIEDPKQRISFEQIFIHPWCTVDKIDFEQSILIARVPQHEEFLNSLFSTINSFKIRLNEVYKNLEQFEKKYQQLQDYCIKFRKELNQGFQTIKLKINYSNQKVIIVYPTEQQYKYFNYKQELLKFLIDIYEEIIKNQIKLDEFPQLFNDKLQICNYIDIRYDQYSIALQDELKQFKYNDKKQQQQELEIQQQENKYLDLDYQILLELLKERCKI